MKNIAHITSRSSYEIGDKVMAICGTKFKVKFLWADVPEDHPICRACVDTAAEALTELDILVQNIRQNMMMISARVQRMDSLLHERRLVVDEIYEADAAYQDELADKAEQKAARKRAKQTCLCTWPSPDVMEENLNCPVHGTPQE